MPRPKADKVHPQITNWRAAMGAGGPLPNVDDFGLAPYALQVTCLDVVALCGTRGDAEGTQLALAGLGPSGPRATEREKGGHALTTAQANSKGGFSSLPLPTRIHSS